TVFSISERAKSITSPCMLCFAPYPGADSLAHHGSSYITRFAKIEHDDWNAVVAAHRDGGGIHHLQVAIHHFVKCEAIESFRSRLLERVAIVDTIYRMTGLKYNVG